MRKNFWEKNGYILFLVYKVANLINHRSKEMNLVYEEKANFYALLNLFSII